MSELQSGDKLRDGKYEVLTKHGIGSLGDTIYQGRDHEMDREITIRVMPREALGDEETAERFFQSVKLTAALQHPNILPAYYAAEERDVHYFVTGADKGFYLDQYLDQRGQLDENEAIRLIVPLAEALNYAWLEQKIIHRNVKPSTILIAKGNKPMLADFGFAKSLQEKKNLTMAGYTVGDPAYMSPEQVQGEELDFRSDMYCLGVVFYQLLAERPPFNDKNQMALMEAHLSTPPPDVKEFNDHVTDAAAAVVAKMLAKGKDDRYATWEDLIDDLKAILNKKPPAALRKAGGVDKKSAAKIKKEAKAEAQKEMKKQMGQVMNKLAQEKRKKLKKTFIIAAVIANVIIIVCFVAYLMSKKKAAESGEGAPKAKATFGRSAE